MEDLEQKIQCGTDKLGLPRHRMSITSDLESSYQCCHSRNCVYKVPTEKYSVCSYQLEVEVQKILTS